MKLKAAPHMEVLNSNISDVQRLLKIASKRKLRADKQILRKGSVVLFTACWEAFIEDLAENGFKFLNKRLRNSQRLPDVVKRHIATKIQEENKDPLATWCLADSGWKNVLKKHARQIISKSVDPVNTPNSKSFDNMFAQLIGLKNWEPYTILP